MDKKRVIDELQVYLKEELAEAGPDATKVESIRRQLLMYRFMPMRKFTGADLICPGGLVELEFNGIRSFYLIVPSGGGLVMRVEGQAVQVITPQSPLGGVLLGRQVGESIEVPSGGSTRSYRIISYS